MKPLHHAWPFWVRAILLAGILGIVSGAALISYHLYRRPTVMTLAVGSSDGGAKQIASVIAGRLATTGSPVLLKIKNVGTARDAAKAFADGTADLAIVRADAGDLHEARAVVVTARGVLTIVAPPGSPISDVARLRGHTVGVIGGEINQAMLSVLKKEYDLDRANIVFRDILPQEARAAMQSKAISALLLVEPLDEKRIAWIKSLFRADNNSSPVLVQIDAAGAIADRKGPYESFDIPKGTFRGAPPVPGDDVTTLRVGYYLVANRHLNSTLIGDLTRKVMNVRRDLMGEQPVLSAISAPELDADAFLPVHPGAAAFFNGTQASFMDRYGNVIYLTPMVLGALASVFAAAWRFLAVRSQDRAANVMEVVCNMLERIRQANDEAALSALELELDKLLRDRVACATADEVGTFEMTMLVSSAQRLDHLIHFRRTRLSESAGVDPEMATAALFAGAGARSSRQQDAGQLLPG